MSLSSARREAPCFCAGIVTARFYETWDFYTGLLGFRTISESNTRVHLQHPGGAQLDILEHEVDGNPSELISAIDGRGLWFSLEVPDLEAEIDRMRSAGALMQMSSIELVRGVRHFMIRDPNGVLIYLTECVKAAAVSEDDNRACQACESEMQMAGA
ncbi:MAG: VOC family protein [Opitutaceae bacterium]|nr:VOC family protein [Opitutaceae bacterium]